MSKDKTPALFKAVAGLPISQSGLALGILNTLRDTKKYPHAHKVFKDALSAVRTPVEKAGVATFDSSKYFVSRKGLHILREEFTKQILPAYPGLIPARGISSVDYDVLACHQYDHDIIINYFGGMEEARKHAFTPDQVADLINAQFGGDAGILFVGDDRIFSYDMPHNILYMIGVNFGLTPVAIYGSHSRTKWYGWNVSVPNFGEIPWRPGSRVIHNKH